MKLSAATKGLWVVCLILMQAALNVEASGNEADVIPSSGGGDFASQNGALGFTDGGARAEKIGLERGLESGLLEDAHPGYGRVAAATFLGFDRLKRPENVSAHSNELNKAEGDRIESETNATAKAENDRSAELEVKVLQEKGKEIEESMTGVNKAQGVGGLDKFEADEKRAATIQRYKVLIKGAVQVMDRLNARLWSWGTINQQPPKLTGTDLESAYSKVESKISEHLKTVPSSWSNETGGNATTAPDTKLDQAGFEKVEVSSQSRHSLGASACTNDCSDRGRCISRRCVCSLGFEGSDCSKVLRHEAELQSKYKGFLSPQKGGEIGDGRKLQVCFVTNEVAGPITNGGIGTAFTTMAHTLAERGHQVTILFTMGEVSMRGTFQDWVAHYEQSGIALLGLQRAPPGTHHVPKALTESHEVLRFLRERSFDVVHFPDYQGAGYYSVLAKRQGLALKGTALVVGVHGPSFWAKKAGNGEPITAVRSLEGNFMEQRTVALADYVVAPSQYILRWMETEGWQLDPAKTFVQPNLLPKTDRSSETAQGKRTALPISELVFFGRLETRKGVVTFCDALDALLGVSHEQETTLGNSTDEVLGLLEEPTKSSELRDAKKTLGSQEQINDGLENPEGLGNEARLRERGKLERDVLDAREKQELDILDVREKLERVTFLGRSAIVEGEWGVEYIQRRARAWGAFPWKIVTRMDPLEAKEYLRGEGRLAVIPSKVENSPYTVYECAELGIPFIAADVGGISDLIHPEDRPHALFDPMVQSLVARLSRALADGVRPARPLVDAAANEEAWMTWHEHTARETRRADGERWGRLEAMLAGNDRPFVSVVMTHYNRPALCKQAIESLEAQDYAAESFEVVLVDDGSTQEDAVRFLDEIEPGFERRGWRVYRQPNAYLGAARNAGARIAKGKYILFMDDDNWAKPHEVSTYVRAMEWGGADVMTSFVDFFWSADARPPSEQDRPSYLFLGGSSDVGAFKNCFGDANCFVRKSSFFEIGGYTEDYGIGYEDWELYANATLLGFQVDVLSDPVYWYRFNPGSMQKTTDYLVNRRRALRPYLNLIPETEHEALLAAVFPVETTARPATSHLKPKASTAALQHNLRRRRSV